MSAKRSGKSTAAAQRGLGRALGRLVPTSPATGSAPVIDRVQSLSEPKRVAWLALVEFALGPRGKDIEAVWQHACQRADETRPQRAWDARWGRLAIGPCDLLGAVDARLPAMPFGAGRLVGRRRWVVATTTAAVSAAAVSAAAASTTTAGTGELLVLGDSDGCVAVEAPFVGAAYPHLDRGARHPGPDPLRGRVIRHQRRVAGIWPVVGAPVDVRRRGEPRTFRPPRRTWLEGGVRRVVSPTARSEFLQLELGDPTWLVRRADSVHLGRKPSKKASRSSVVSCGVTCAGIVCGGAGAGFSSARCGSTRGF